MDTPDELKRAAYMEAHGLSHCENCHRDVPTEETTEDLDECICNECRPAVERTCKVCLQKSGNWYGTETESGFLCDGCQ